MAQTLKPHQMSMDHVSLTVENVDRSIEFYKAVGLKLLRISVLRRNDGKEYRNAYMYSGRFMLELLPSLKPRQRVKKLPPTVEKALQGSTGITHLGVRVGNLNRAVKRLQAAGAPMIGEPFRIEPETANTIFFDERADPALHYVRKPVTKPWRIAMFADPDGVAVELVER